MARAATPFSVRFVACAFVLSAAALQIPIAAAQDTSALRWAGDPEGGAPFVEADPANPEALVGFDVEIAELLARGLGRMPQFVLASYQYLDQSVARGDADIGLSGLEFTRARRQTMAVSVPYYAFREVLSVRNADAARLRTLADLAGRRVGTLVNTIAYDILLDAEREHGLIAVSYEDDVHPYSDLMLGRVDAVLLDNVLAERRQNTIPGYTIQPDSVALGHYVAVLAPGNIELRDRINQLILSAMREGQLEAIFRRWKVWNADQPPLHARVLSGDPVEPFEPDGRLGEERGVGESAGTAVWQYLPALVRAAGVTLLLSCLAMTLAVALGAAIASGRVYGGASTRATLTVYVEVMRGTPLLLQLFVLYYGMAGAVQLPAFGAALLGLALNYAAYESEIYRAALLAVPTGQLEAARVLGLTERQVLTLVRGPQAFRLALAPMTNDFVALLKDSSLVSVLTVMELTKQTQIFATNLGSWVVPGLLCAGLYLAMSLPLAAAARRMETRWKTPTA